MNGGGASTNGGLLDRVLVLVKGSRDSELTKEILARVGVSACACSGIDDLCAKIEEGGAAALLAEEVLTADCGRQLASTLSRQPPWSDFPLVIFSARRATENVRPVDGLDRALGNVTFLDRPVRIRTMLASVHAAIRSRHRQYAGRRAIESRDTFLAMLGHELRNPLAALCLAAGVLDKKLPEGQRPKEWGVISRHASLLTRLVDDLLDVARITHGKVMLRREQLNLAELVRGTFEALEGRARENGLTFHFQEPDRPIWVEGDLQRLEQVFANLLTNAIKYTPGGGSVRVTVELGAAGALVTIADTGIGIPAEMLGEVFDVFAQADRSPDRTEGGMGLGLAVVRSLVQLHGGTVEAASPGAGQGSSFVVRLPLVMTDVAPKGPVTSGLERPSATRVVVVEDSADIRELLTALLELGGHNVASADDGPNGLERILSVTPDIAFVDLGLPGFDGYELARRARARGSRARLVAVTGYGLPEDRKRALEAGFDDHLTKPVIEADLNRAMLRLGGQGRL